MSGILPDGSNGGMIVRDAGGVATNPPGVANAHIPESVFVSSCLLTALPGDCTGRITPAQINAIVSEILCFAEKLQPNGPWDCDSLCNLASLFEAWVASKFNSDGETITGDGSVENPYTLQPVGAVAAVCASSEASNNLALCLISSDAGNTIEQGSDGKLFSTAAVASGEVSSEVENDDPVTPTVFFGENTAYLGRPVRWIDLTIPGVSGTVRVASYS